MTDQERIKRLAEWMGWHGVSYGKWVNALNDVVADFTWNPITRIQDAMMMVDKVLFYVLVKSGDKATCYIGGDIVVNGRGKDECEAICRAIEALMEGQMITHCQICKCKFWKLGVEPLAGDPRYCQECAIKACEKMEAYNELWQAFSDLSFECCGGMWGTQQPSIEIYNRTFEVLNRLRPKD